MPGTVADEGALELSVNGKVLLQSSRSKPICDATERIAGPSTFRHLQTDDLTFTSTPEGAIRLQPGDRIEGRVDGVGTIALTVGPAR